MAGKGDKLDRILEELKKLDVLDKKFDSLNTKIETLTATTTTLRTDVTANTTDINNLRAEFESFKQTSQTETRQLKTAFNNREQQLRSTTIRVFNMPVVGGESIDNYKALANRVYERLLRPALVAAKAAGDLGVIPQQATIIEACYRVFQQREPEPGAPPAPVVVRLSSRQFKFSVMKYRKAAASPSEADRETGGKRLIVVEDLTPPAHKLLKELQADSRVEKVWTINGQVHYVLTGTAGYKKVKNIFDPIDSFLPPPAAPAPV